MSHKTQLIPKGARCALLCLLLSVCSCSSHRETTVREETTTATPVTATTVEPQEVRVTEVRKEESGHKGIFGIIGDIITLPFRAIGSLF